MFTQKGSFIMKKSRTFRKSFVAAIAALCLAAPLTVMPVSAYNITVNKPTTNPDNVVHTYEAYQIFAGDYNDNVLSNIKWGTGVDTTKSVGGVTLISAIQAITVNGGTPFAGLDEASEIANKLSENQSKDNDVVKAFAEVVGDYLNATSGTAGSTGVTNLNNAGYYLVQDSGNVTGEAAKTRYILQVAGADVTVTAKSSYPTIVKKVQENTDVGDYDVDNGKNLDAFEDHTNYNDVADYNIGDDVPFIDIGTLPDTLDDYDEYYYEIVDTSDKGLDPNTTVGSDGKVTGGVTVKIDGVGVTEQATITEETNEQTGETTIKVVFEDIKSIDKGDDGTTDVSVTKDSIVTVEYDSKLKEDADIGLEGQESKVKLNFSNDPNEDYDSENDEDGPDGIGTTPEDKVIVFTYELDITKYLGEKSDNQKEIEGEAGFKLYKTVDGKEMVATLNANKKITGWEEATNEDAGTQISTDSNGVVKFIGIDEGTYTIKETDTPNGYNTMEPKTIVIAANTLDEATDAVTTVDRQEWTTTADKALLALTCDNVAGDLTNGNVTIDVENFKGSTLPSTGGIGTTIFYLGGGTMAAVAGVYLITKKRMKNEEDDEI